MPAPTVEAPVTGIVEPSMADLRRMVAVTRAAEPLETEEDDTREDNEQGSESDENKRSASGTEKQTPQEDDEDEDLPKGVVKRIERETARAARVQAEIDKAVSTRKAKESELAKLTSNQGSEPVKQTEQASDAEPQEPDLATFKGSLAEYQDAQKKFRADYREWVRKDTQKTVEQQYREQQFQTERAKLWADADKRFSEAGVIKAGEFGPLMDSLTGTIPEPMQLAISALDDWQAVALHFAQHEDERDAMVQLFKANEKRGSAELGKLEDRLKPAATSAEANKEPENKRRPLRPVAGGAAGVAPPVDLEKASFSAFKGEVTRRLKR